MPHDPSAGLLNGLAESERLSVQFLWLTEEENSVYPHNMSAGFLLANASALKVASKRRKVSFAWVNPGAEPERTPR